MKIEQLILRKVKHVKKGSLNLSCLIFIRGLNTLTWLKSLNPSIYYYLQWLRHFLAVVNMPHAWILMMIMWNF